MVKQDKDMSTSAMLDSKARMTVKEYFDEVIFKIQMDRSSKYKHLAKDLYHIGQYLYCRDPRIVKPVKKNTGNK